MELGSGLLAISKFPRASEPLTVKGSAFDMEMIFHSYANRTHFRKKGCALDLVLKVRGFGTRKWPIMVPLRKIVLCAFLFLNYSHLLTNRQQRSYRL